VALDSTILTDSLSERCALYESAPKTVDNETIVAATPVWDWVRSKHFEPQFWQAEGEVTLPAGGRGSAWFVSNDDARWVLRHYRRGGLVARFTADRYLFLGAERTRCFAELRLLAWMQQMALPAPKPIAARFQRLGLTYQADLLIDRLPNTLTLAQAIQERQAIDWEKIGHCIRQFHQHGVCHRDLNAHNILLGDGCFLIDFDRATRRRAGSWQRSNLQRLQRSLRKISADCFEQQISTGWRTLLTSYEAA